MSLASSTAPVNITETEDEVPITKLAVNEKSQIKIECQVTGLPKPTVKWLRNDIDLKNDDKSKLENKQEVYALSIKDFSIKEKGAYVIVAENEIGSARNKIYVDINNIPVVVKGLVNTEVELKENLQVELACIYKSRPKADVTWLVGDKTLKDGDENARVTITDETAKDDEGNEIMITKIKLSPATLSDSGSYKCKLKNCAGEVVSNANLSILKSSQFIEGLPESLEVVEKKEIKLVAKILDSVPKSIITWHKDGSAINNTKKFLVGKPTVDESTNALVYTLTVTDCLLTDSGVYSIKSSNKVSTVESKCNVGILSVPKITKDLKPNIECAENDKVHMEVTATGRPVPEFKWYYFNLETNSEEEVLPIEGEISSQVLSDSLFSIDFLNIKQSMKGKYTLRLTNKAGSAETSCNVVVNGNFFF